MPKIPAAQPTGRTVGIADPVDLFLKATSRLARTGTYDLAAGNDKMPRIDPQEFERRVQRCKKAGERAQECAAAEKAAQEATRAANEEVHEAYADLRKYVDDVSGLGGACVSHPPLPCEWHYEYRIPFA